METYIGMILQFTYGFAPQNWESCEGQTLQIQQNTALFSLIGTNFGGNGKTTFCLPDLRPRDSDGNLLNLNLGDKYNGGTYIPSYICTSGLYPSRP